MIQPKSSHLIAERLALNRVDGLKQASKHLNKQDDQNIIIILMN